MIGVNLLTEAADQLPFGQQRLAHSTKQLVSQLECPIVRLLDYANDKPFLEPWLFAFLGSQESGPTLEQVLFGSLLDRSVLSEFKVRSNSQALAFLPAIGYLQVERANCDSLLRSDQIYENELHRCAVSESDIEVCLADDDLLDVIMQESGGGDYSIDPLEVSRHAHTLDRAFEVMEQVVPELFHVITQVTRRIVLFRSKQVGSFATVRAHGGVFLNLANQDDATEVFFIEDLAHQCGHVVFTAMSTNRSEFFEIDPTTPLRQLTGDESDHRDVYTGLHGVFTEALMCIALHHCLEAKLFSEEMQHEVVGRMSFIMKKFHLDLIGLRQSNIFTARGANLVLECGKIFDEVYRHNERRIVGIDLRNQSYVFSYDRFKERNQPAKL